MITTSKDKNVLLEAVENRQPSIIEAVQKQVNKELKTNFSADHNESVDTDGNTILHLAAKYELQIQGSSAMHMQHQAKLYEYVKSFLPYHFTFLSNRKRETPGEIFLRHKDLVEKSDEWLSRTSESCSVVAAQVAGVSFRHEALYLAATMARLADQPKKDNLGLIFSLSLHSLLSASPSLH